MYNNNHLIKSLKLSYELKFEDFNISEKHLENWFILFTDKKESVWSIDACYNGGFNICYDDVKVCVVDETLKNMLNEFIEYHLNESNRQEERDKERIDFNNELWKNYGYGKI